jgi:hypothetical protein
MHLNTGKDLHRNILYGQEANPKRSGTDLVQARIGQIDTGIGISILPPNPECGECHATKFLTFHLTSFRPPDIFAFSTVKK